MKKEHELVITRYLNVAPIEINSAKVSAQNRVRLYWTNIANEPYGLFGDMKCVIPQPKDKGILLKDVLERDVPEKYYLSEKMVNNLFNTYTGTYSSFPPTKPKDINRKASCMTARQHKMGKQDNYIVDKKTYCLDTGNSQAVEVIQLNNTAESGGKQPYQQNRVYDPNRISPALLAQMSCGTHAILENEAKIRRLTPTECARLQTIPEWYIWACSDTQQYKMLGNGWTIEVIKHILSYL